MCILSLLIRAATNPLFSFCLCRLFSGMIVSFCYPSLSIETFDVFHYYVTCTNSIRLLHWTRLYEFRSLSLRLRASGRLLLHVSDAGHDRFPDRFIFVEVEEVSCHPEDNLEKV